MHWWSSSFIHFIYQKWYIYFLLSRRVTSFFIHTSSYSGHWYLSSYHTDNHLLHPPTKEKAADNIKMAPKKTNKPVEKDRPMPFSLGLPIFDPKVGKYVDRQPTKEPPKRPTQARRVRAKDMTLLHKWHDVVQKAQKRAQRWLDSSFLESSNKKEDPAVKVQEKSVKVGQPASTLRYVQTKHKPVDLAGWFSHGKDPARGPVFTGSVEKKRK